MNVELSISLISVPNEESRSNARFLSKPKFHIAKFLIAFLTLVFDATVLASKVISMNNTYIYINKYIYV
jgi:hypothetical protein